MALLTTTQIRAAWHPWLGRCTSAPFTDVHVWGRTIGGVPTPAVDAVLAWEQAHRAAGYTPASVWAYNFRGIGGAPCSCSDDGHCSIHAFGLAIDVDPKLNPYSNGDPYAGKYTPAQVAMVKAIRTTDGDQAWAWGGDWNKPDRMHWQLAVPPGHKIDWSTVPGTYVPPKEDDMAIRKGDTGNTVAKMQKGLNGWVTKFRKPQLDAHQIELLLQDGIFADVTEQRLVEYQKGADLDNLADYQAGVCDGVCYASLMEYVPDWIDDHTAPAETKVPDHRHQGGAVIRE